MQETASDAGRRCRAEHIEMMVQKYTGGSYPWYGGRDQMRVVITIEAEKVSSTGR